MAVDRDRERSGDHRDPFIGASGGGDPPIRGDADRQQGMRADGAAFDRSDDVTHLGVPPATRSPRSMREVGASPETGVEEGDGSGRRKRDPDDGTLITAVPRRGGSSIGPVVTSTLAAMQEIGRRLEGATLGAYHLEEFVGGGGMGAVFRAIDTTLDRTVAVKVLFAHEAADEEVVRRFRNEAQSAARLDHDNIGRVHAVGYEEGWHFIVFEFIEGRNLRDIVAETGAFDIRRTVDVTLQLAEALAHAAERDVVHRDIKPSNVIITPEGRAKLVDMGLARLHQVTGGNDLTVSGMTLGTFDYISPEQARDPRAADVRSDLYSLGCTIYFLLAGHPPFAEGTMVQKLLQHQQELAVPVERLRPDVPPALAAAVARLMEKDPADRQQTPAALIADLADLAVTLGIHVAPERLGSPRRSSSSRSLVGSLWWLVPVVGLVAIVGGSWWLEPAAIRSTDRESSGGAVVRVPGPAAAPLAGELAEQSGGSEGAGDGSRRTLDERLLAAVDGERIVLGEGVFGLTVTGLVRAKSLQVVGAGAGSTLIRFDRPTTNAAGISLEEAAILFEGLSIDVPAEAAASLATEGVFRLAGASRLQLRDVVLTLRGAESMAAIGEEPAIMVVAEVGGGGATGAASAAVVLEHTSVTADATIVRVDAGGAFRADVDGCDVSTSRRFLLAKGSGGRPAEAAAVTMRVESTRFSCGAGFACLVDSQSRPVGRRLRVAASDCRFQIPGQAALVEQAGIGEPDGYFVNLDWTDGGSRYEGSAVFRRIDGAAERVEIDYASAPEPFDHAPSAEPRP